MSRPRAADDFATIRARIEELRREREQDVAAQDPRAARPNPRRSDSDAEQWRRDRMEGLPPPWVPTIFIKSSEP